MELGTYIGMSIVNCTRKIYTQIANMEYEILILSVPCSYLRTGKCKPAPALYTVYLLYYVTYIGPR
jgi:hypothetical protein